MSGLDQTDQGITIAPATSSALGRRADQPSGDNKAAQVGNKQQQVFIRAQVRIRHLVSPSLVDRLIITGLGSRVFGRGFNRQSASLNYSSSMNILERIRQRAASKPQHIVLPEGNDPRTVVAASLCSTQRLARITLLGDENVIRRTASERSLDISGVTISNHRRAADFDKMVGFFHDLRRAKGLMADEARTLVSDPLYYGNLMVRMGHADGSVAGATNTTSHTVRAALHCIGVRPGFKLVSSFF
jgi:hypothetical protein